MNGQTAAPVVWFWCHLVFSSMSPGMNSVWYHFLTSHPPALRYLSRDFLFRNHGINNAILVMVMSIYCFGNLLIFVAFAPEKKESEQSAQASRNKLKLRFGGCGGVFSGIRLVIGGIQPLPRSTSQLYVLGISVRSYGGPYTLKFFCVELRGTSVQGSETKWHMLPTGWSHNIHVKF